MTQATTVAELYRATEGWGLIDHNLVAGDTAGSIGHLVRARVPRRIRANGWLTVPGWDPAHAWNGWISHEDMPCVIDPAEGLIVTANNRVAADDHPDYLCTDCHPPYRAARIMQLLREGKAFAVSDAAAIHADTASPTASLFIARLARLPTHPNAKAEALRRRILDWDGFMDAASRSATDYNAFRRSLTKIVAARSGLEKATAHSFANVAPGISPHGQIWWVIPTLLRNDDTCLLAGRSWSETLADALAMAAENESDGAWGIVHQPRFTHALSAHFPAAAELLNPPSRPIGGDGDTVQANGLIPAIGPRATYGALSRYVFDVGGWDNSRWVVFHGTSGHPGSPHYADQNAPWSACEMVPMIYDWQRIVAEGKSTQLLEPL